MKYCKLLRTNISFIIRAIITNQFLWPINRSMFSNDHFRVNSIKIFQNWIIFFLNNQINKKQFVKNKNFIIYAKYVFFNYLSKNVLKVCIKRYKKNFKQVAILLFIEIRRETDKNKMPDFMRKWAVLFLHRNRWKICINKGCVSRNYLFTSTQAHD